MLMMLYTGKRDRMDLKSKRWVNHIAILTKNQSVRLHLHQRFHFTFKHTYYYPCFKTNAWSSIIKRKDWLRKIHKRKVNFYCYFLQTNSSFSMLRYLPIVVKSSFKNCSHALVNNTAISLRKNKKY